MKRLVWKKLVGQRRPREVLAAAVSRGALGHAYLFCGEEGVGTVQAAIELAMGLLCESQDDAPCYTCPSCVKVLHNAHQDLHLVAPVVLLKEHRSKSDLSESGWEYVADEMRARIAAPYRRDDVSGVPSIPVDWIREVDHAIRRGPVSGPSCVAIICAPEQMRAETANAMLKTLEEPPAGSVVLLCSESPHAVLPTIRSRCQVVRFGCLSDEEVTEGLRQLHPETLSEEQLAFVLESAQGSLGAALRLAAEPHPEAMQAARELWDLVGEDDVLRFATGIDRLAEGLEAGGCERMLSCCMHIVRNALVSETTLTPLQAQALLGACRRAVRGARARAVVPLLLAGFAYEAREIVHG